jgi:long-chain acyl-CoA synthetase
MRSGQRIRADKKRDRPMTASSRFNLGALIDLDVNAHRPLLIDCRRSEHPVTWTGQDLEAQADAVARGLQKRGLVPGDRVAIISSNRAEYLTAYYGIMRAGFVAVPINFKLAPDTVRYVLSDCNARFAMVDAQHRGAAEHIANICFDDADAFAAFLDPGPFETLVPGPDDIAMFLYTSGSTGQPKGVPLSHAGHLWVIDQRFQANVDYHSERMLVAAPLYHMNALAISKFAAAAGSTVVLLPQFSAQTYLGAVERFACTWLTSVPTMMALVTQRSDLLATTDISSVRSVRMGSAPVTNELLERVGECFPRAKIQIGYGTTEAGPVAFGPHPDGLQIPPLSLGYAHPQVRLRLRDGAGNDVNEGVLEMDCPALMPGYHNLPEKTASVMNADGYYHTGDVMRRDAHGFYYFVGRDDDMFVCNGENVFPEEVERLLESHSSITQACVVPLEDKIRGFMPVAFIVSSDEGVFDEQALKQHTIDNGPAYQHPRHIFQLALLPLASTNKIDRRALIAQAKAHFAEAP